MAPLKIVSFLCQYQDPEYLDAVLTNFKWLPDKLYILEGAWKSAMKDGSDPRSDQRTYEIIAKHVDNEKVFLIQSNEETEVKQRQVGLELAKHDKADWCWMIDSDEVYTKSTMQAIQRILTNAPSFVHTYRVRSYNFINSFKRWYDGDYARIYRVTPDAQFIMNNDVQFYQDGRVVGSFKIPEQLRFHHYNYVKLDPEHMWTKLRAHENDDPNFKQQHTHRYGHQGNQYTLPSDIPIFTYTGKHPLIMKDHPNFVNNIYNDHNLQFMRE